MAVKRSPSERAPRLPEDEARVEAYRRALQKNRSRIVDEAAAFRVRWLKRGVETLTGVGLPLRPLFLPRRRLEQIAGGIALGLERLRKELLRHAEQPRWLARHLPLPEDLYRALDVRAGLESPAFSSVFRPDGFLSRDEFVLSEVNYGNGIIVSATYNEALFDFFARHPVMGRPEWDAGGAIDRPFQHWLAMLKRQVKRTPASVALVAHREEWDVIKGYPPRVIQQFRQAMRRLRRAGLDVQLVHEDHLVVDSRGRALIRGRRKAVDLVLFVTIGTSFIDSPQLLSGKLKALRGSHAGKTPILKPLVGLCVDKGTLPLMLEKRHFPVRFADGFEVTAADTRYLTPSDRGWLERDRKALVLKKAFDGKDTHVGVSTEKRKWAQVVTQASQGLSYVAQAYSPLPRTEMPVLLDGKHLEWIPVRVELTPFIVEGRYAGAFARYAPDAPGLILSPPPEEMGMTMVAAC